MSTDKALEQLFANYFPVAEQRIIATWEVSYHDACRWCSDGRLPEAIIHFPIDGARAMQFPESFYWLWMQYRDRAKILIERENSRPGYRVHLVEQR